MYAANVIKLQSYEYECAGMTVRNTLLSCLDATVAQSYIPGRMRGRVYVWDIHVTNLVKLWPHRHSDPTCNEAC